MDELESMRCPRRPRRARANLDSSDGHLLEVNFVVPEKVMACATIATWQGLPSSLAAAATTLSIAGRMQGNETLLRVLLLASTPFWATHDLLVGSLPGLIADLMSMAIGAAMLLRAVSAHPGPGLLTAPARPSAGASRSR